MVIGDLCPLPQTLALLRRFFQRCPGTRLHLHFEAISGPWKRLLDISGRYLRGGQVEIVAARRREATHGPVANRLWRYIEEQARGLVRAIS